jgi:GNAT superfamily N-acetyltransferase
VKILPAAPTDFESDILLLRVQTVTSGGDSDVLLFRILECGEESALVALRTDDDEAAIELEEIFVLPELRGGGLGGRVIEGIVEICRGMGRTRITVWAHPLEDAEDDVDAEVRLVDWYLRCGFSRSGAWDELERPI